MSGIDETTTHGLFVDGSRHVLQASDLQSLNELFPLIFLVFVILGTLVGIIVIGYMLYAAYKYREGEHRSPESDANRPQLGELPEGGGGGRKLFISLTLSALIVIGLIGWTYTMLSTVEAGPPAEEDIEIKVVGQQFSWQFIYPNGYKSSTLRIPEDRPVTLTVTSKDVMHNFGIPAFSIKTDAIPGQTTDTWFVAQNPGTYQAQCFELCGSGHSQMDSKVIVMKPKEFEKWYAGTTPKESVAITDNSSSTQRIDPVPAESRHTVRLPPLPQ